MIEQQDGETEREAGGCREKKTTFLADGDQEEDCDRGDEEPGDVRLHQAEQREGDDVRQPCDPISIALRVLPRAEDGGE